MTVSFYQTKKYEQEAICSICLDALEIADARGVPRVVVTHDSKHFMHQDCIRIWAKRNPNCPVCRGKVDGLSLMPGRERAAKRVKTISLAALKATIVAGATIGGWKLGGSDRMLSPLLAIIGLMLSVIVVHLITAAEAQREPETEVARDQEAIAEIPTVQFSRATEEA